MSNLEIIAVMVGAGLCGGTANFALSRTEHSRWPDCFWSVVVGIVASFLVPLFLNTISSSLLSGLLSDSSGKADIYVFAGFCLLAAIASQAMIQTLTQRLLRESQETRKEVESLKEEVSPIVAKETEPESPGSSPFKVEAYGLVGDEPNLIIKSLGNSKYSRRTPDGIQKETSVPRNKVIETLHWLEANGLAVSAGGVTGRYWSLTKKGRNVFQSVLEQK
jgi:hypothetical protein